MGLNRELAGWVATMIRSTRKRAKAFIGADYTLKRDAISKLKGPVVESWTLTMKLGSVDLPELGGEQWVWWRGWRSLRSQSASRLLVRSQGGGAPGTFSSISHEFFEELGRVPDRLACGKPVRWESNGEMLRAFVENKAIYYRPEAKKGEDVRISLETAPEAWKMLEKRDRLAVWFTKEVEPGLVALLRKGRD